MGDTLMYFKRLEAAGFSRQQAEAQVEMMAEFTTNSFATSQDLKDMSRVLSKDIKDLEHRIDARFVEFQHRIDLRFAESEKRTDARFAEFDKRIDARFAESDKRIDARFAEVDARFVRLENEIARMGDRLTIRLGSMMLVGFGALAALIKLT